MVNAKKLTKTKPKLKPTLSFKNCVCIVYNSVVHNVAQNSCDNLPSYPPDSHCCSYAVYCLLGT